MQTRSITYTRHDPSDPALGQDFVIVEADSDDGLHHAVAVPRGWSSTDAPIDPDPAAPVLGALHVEGADRGPEGGVIVAGHVPRVAFDDAPAVVHHLTRRDGFEPYRYNDEDDGAGGTRAMASTATHRMALRVLPHGAVWAFVAAVVPKDRFDAIGGVLQAAVVTFRLPPSWAGPVDGG